MSKVGRRSHALLHLIYWVKNITSHRLREYEVKILCSLASSRLENAIFYLIFTQPMGITDVPSNNDGTWQEISHHALIEMCWGMPTFCSSPICTKWANPNIFQLAHGEYFMPSNFTIGGHICNIFGPSINLLPHSFVHCDQKKKERKNPQRYEEN